MDITWNNKVPDHNENMTDLDKYYIREKMEKSKYAHRYIESVDDFDFALYFQDFGYCEKAILESAFRRYPKLNAEFMIKSDVEWPSYYRRNKEIDSVESFMTHLDKILMNKVPLELIKITANKFIRITANKSLER